MSQKGLNRRPGPTNLYRELSEVEPFALTEIDALDALGRSRAAVFLVEEDYARGVDGRERRREETRGKIRKLWAPRETTVLDRDGVTLEESREIAWQIHAEAETTALLRDLADFEADPWKVIGGSPETVIASTRSDTNGVLSRTSDGGRASRRRQSRKAQARAKKAAGVLRRRLEGVSPRIDTVSPKERIRLEDLRRTIQATLAGFPFPVRGEYATPQSGFQNGIIHTNGRNGTSDARGDKLPPPMPRSFPRGFEESYQTS